ncbi:MAG: hypothetical protein H0W40_07820 [Methylibium sp.]|nr:hypothetical protein [Methylibium sp.]
MFGKSKPVVFEPYGRRRRQGLPGWLMLLLAGIAVGAGGVLYVQASHLPPRLSASDSVQLRQSFDQAEGERQRLAAELAETRKQLEASLAEKRSLSDELTATRTTTENLREDVASVVAALPPDPRGGAVEVRAANLSVEGGALAYHVVLSRDRETGKPLTGVMQFVVAGQSARGTPTSVPLKPIPISVGSHESLRGSLPLPEGFDPRQATINVLDRVDGNRLGMRVMYVK